MNRKGVLCALGMTAVLFLGALSYQNRAASQSKADDVKDSLADQVKELKKLTEVQAKGPRIVAAGTAIYTRPEVQDNRTVAPVKLAADVAGRLGEDYIVLLTMRAPVGGYPYFNCYWKKTAAGFDIYVVDTTVTGPGGTTASYENRNKDYPVDWIVVKK